MQALQKTESMNQYSNLWPVREPICPIVPQDAKQSKKENNEIIEDKIMMTNTQNEIKEREDMKEEKKENEETKKEKPMEESQQQLEHQINIPKTEFKKEENGKKENRGIIKWMTRWVAGLVWSPVRWIWQHFKTILSGNSYRSVV